MAIQYEEFRLELSSPSTADLDEVVLQVRPQGRQRHRETQVRAGITWHALRTDVAQMLGNESAPMGHRIAEVLGGLLLPGAVLGQFWNAASDAAANGAGLRLIVRCEAEDVASLPWEAAFIQTSPGEGPAPGKYLALQPDLALLREDHSQDGRLAIRVDEAVRVVTCDASQVVRDRPFTPDVPTLAATSRQGDGRTFSTVALDPHEDTVSRAIAELRQAGPLGVFHLCGHGSDDARGVYLQRTAGDRGRVSVTGGMLRDWLSRADVQLVYLSACNSAAAGSRHTMVREVAQLPIPAVLGMQARISDQAAGIFSRAFYAALVQGDCYAAAVTRARISLADEHRHTAAWVTPVFYLNAPDAPPWPVDDRLPQPAAHRPAVMLAPALDAFRQPDERPPRRWAQLALGATSWRVHGSDNGPIRTELSAPDAAVAARVRRQARSIHVSADGAVVIEVTGDVLRAAWIDRNCGEIVRWNEVLRLPTRLLGGEVLAVAAGGNAVIKCLVSATDSTWIARFHRDGRPTQILEQLSEPSALGALVGPGAWTVAPDGSPRGQLDEHLADLDLVTNLDVAMRRGSVTLAALGEEAGARVVTATVLDTQGNVQDERRLEVAGGDELVIVRQLGTGDRPDAILLGDGAKVTAYHPFERQMHDVDDGPSVGGL